MDEKKVEFLIDFLQKSAEKSKAAQNKCLAFAHKIPGWAFKYMQVSITYFFFIFIFMNVYNIAGFERTIIILLVGVVYFAIRKG